VLNFVIFFTWVGITRLAGLNSKKQLLRYKGLKRQKFDSLRRESRNAPEKHRAEAGNLAQLAFAGITCGIYGGF